MHLKTITYLTQFTQSGDFQAHDERNYHIFYCMLAGLAADELQELELTKATDYYYLTQVSISSNKNLCKISNCLLAFQGNCTTVEGRDDRKELADIRAAMKVLLFNDQEMWSIFKILAALLHIGNIQYNGKHVSP